MTVIIPLGEPAVLQASFSFSFAFMVSQLPLPLVLSSLSPSLTLFSSAASCLFCHAPFNSYTNKHFFGDRLASQASNATSVVCCQVWMATSRGHFTGLVGNVNDSNT